MHPRIWCRSLVLGAGSLVAVACGLSVPLQQEPISVELYQRGHARALCEETRGSGACGPERIKQSALLSAIFALGGREDEFSDPVTLPTYASVEAAREGCLGDHPPSKVECASALFASGAYDDARLWLVQVIAQQTPLGCRAAWSGSPYDPAALALRQLKASMIADVMGTPYQQPDGPPAFGFRCASR